MKIGSKITKKIDNYNSDESLPRPGFVHFDLLNGCSLDLLSGSLIDLGVDEKFIFGSLSILGLPLKRVVISDFSIADYRGKLVRVNLPSFINSTAVGNKAVAKVNVLHEEVGNRPEINKNQEDKADKAMDASRVRSCFIGDNSKKEQVLLSNIAEVVDMQKLSPVQYALSIKIINILLDGLKKSHPDGYKKIRVSKDLCLGLLIRIVIFVACIEFLSPSGVSASKIAVSMKESCFCEDLNRGLDRYGWLLSLLQGIPIVEREIEASICDPLAVACLRAVVQNFGARGDSLILTYGQSAVDRESHLSNVKALWCRPSLPVTSNAGYSSMDMSKNLLYCLQCGIGDRVNTQDLSLMLRKKGAFDTYTWSTFRSDNHSHKTFLQTTLHYRDLEEVSKVLLVAGEAKNILVNSIEKRSLFERIVSVPFGRGQKIDYCRVIEYLLAGKICRVEPLEEDFSRLQRKTGYQRESLKKDILLSWEKTTKKTQYSDN